MQMGHVRAGPRLRYLHLVDIGTVKMESTTHDANIFLASSDGFHPSPSSAMSLQ